MDERRRIRAGLGWLLRAVSARRTRVFVLALVVTFAFLIFPTWHAWRFYQASEQLSSQGLQLQRLMGRILYLDEVLSMSAQMAIATGESRWQQRYLKSQPRLEAALEQTISLAAGAHVAAAERTAAASRNLIAMDRRALSLVSEGRGAEAEALLVTPEYQRTRRDYSEARGILNDVLDERLHRRLLHSERQFLGAGALTVASAATLMLAWIGVVALIWRHLASRARAEEERLYLESQIQYMQKLESLGVLAGGIAHDFNNLLMPILGNADLVLSDLTADAPHRKHLERLRGAGKRLADLTAQLLAYTGKGAFALKPVHLTTLVTDTAQLLELSVSKQADLRYELTEDLPSIDADSSQLVQVVMNLVTNASDALDPEGGLITLRTGSMQADQAYLTECYVFDDSRFDDSREGTYVFLDVTDSGSGMDAETRRRVFDPFFTTKFTGRGLGLAVILGIVRGHRGAIRLLSQPGEGTTFRVLFPRSERPERPSSPPPRRREPWSATGLILIVDDEPDVRELSEIMITRLGFRVLTARDGAEALETFHKRTDEIDVVLLDLTMPGMSGEETFVEIRRHRPEQRIVLMSGYSEEFAAGRAEGSFSRFLQKPFTGEELSDTLRSLLEESH